MSVLVGVIQKREHIETMNLVDQRCIYKCPRDKNKDSRLVSTEV